jgi:hypothetical protein
MDFEDDLRDAAKRADRGVRRAMSKIRYDRIDEDDLTGVLAGNLEAELDGVIGRLKWSTHIMRHRRGTAAEERLFGADILIHVSFETSVLIYSKGTFIQAKKQERHEPISPREWERLTIQCKTMLTYTPAAFVFNYASTGMRCGSALAISGSSGHDLWEQCPWTSYPFFLELFRCPIGDERISSANVQRLSKLPEDAAPVPTIIELSVTAPD